MVPEGYTTTVGLYSAKACMTAASGSVSQAKLQIDSMHGRRLKPRLERVLGHVMRHVVRLEDMSDNSENINRSESVGRDNFKPQEWGKSAVKWVKIQQAMREARLIWEQDLRHDVGKST